jgi:predicted sulfurtransferase
MLPVARVMKAWSVVLNVFGKVGPVPEGMSATTALRVDHLKRLHAWLRADVLKQAVEFQRTHGYVAPFWELEGFASSSTVY